LLMWFKQIRIGECDNHQWDNHQTKWRSLAGISSRNDTLLLWANRDDNGIIMWIIVYRIY
jgi:hypothetical protein